MRTNNDILRNYELNDINDVLKSKNVVVHRGGRYIQVEDSWVTPDSVASRIKTLSKNIQPKEEGLLKEVIDNYIDTDKEGYSKLDKKMHQAKLLDAATMKSARFFKTLFSRPQEKRHEMLRSIKTPIETAIKNKDRQVEILNEKPDNQIKIYYAKVLETSDFTLKDEGYTQSGALQSYLQDLKDYRKKLVELHQPVPKRLNGVIQELEFAYKISLAENLPGRTKEKGKELIIHQILEKIKHLETGSILIPGGSDEHAVMYKIERAKNGFNFTVINTGEGADVNIIRSAWTVLTKGRLTVEDAVYSNLKMDRFSEDFISSIISHKFKNMDETNDFIENSLNKSGHSGRKHKEQVKGSCAFKNVSTTIHEKLGNEEYNRFKVFVTENEIDKLKNSSVPRKLRTEMLSEGITILKYRKRKIS